MATLTSTGCMYGYMSPLCAATNLEHPGVMQFLLTIECKSIVVCTFLYPITVCLDVHAGLLMTGQTKYYYYLFIYLFRVGHKGCHK